MVWSTLRIMLCNVPYEPHYNELGNTPNIIGKAKIIPWHYDKFSGGGFNNLREKNKIGSIDTFWSLFTRV